MKNLEHSVLLIFTVFVSLLFAHPTETQNNVETISQAPTELPPLTCANVTCPKGASTCIYTERTTPDQASIERNSTCTGKNGEVLFSNTYKVPNDFKGHKFLQISNSVGGNLQTIGDFGGFDAFTDLDRHMDDIWSMIRNFFN